MDRWDETDYRQTNLQVQGHVWVLACMPKCSTGNIYRPLAINCHTNTKHKY